MVRPCAYEPPPPPKLIDSCIDLLTALVGSTSSLNSVEVQHVTNWTISHPEQWKNVAQQIRLKLDSPVFLYEKVELECRYRLNGKELYSIKW